MVNGGIDQHEFRAALLDMGMPNDTPLGMEIKYFLAISASIENPQIKSAFSADTGFALDGDKMWSMSEHSEYVIAFIAWFNQEVWAATYRPRLS